MKKLFTHELYIKVSRNTFRILSATSLGAEQAFTPTQPFTTQRLLVGQFSVAQDCLRQAIKSMTGKGWFPPTVVAVLHPLELIDGGLSEVEERVFRELALGAGARKVALWTGKELGPDDITNLLKNA